VKQVTIIKIIRKVLSAVLILISPGLALAQTCADLNGAYVNAQDGQYLGFFGNQFASESINNTFGSYGSQFSSTSVRNDFSSYGSQFGIYSANNDFSSSPPIIYKYGDSIGYLTTNELQPGGVSLASIDASCTFSATSPYDIPLQVPTSLTGLIASDGAFTDAVLLTWNASLGATSYDVYFSTTEFGSRTFISSTPSTSMTVTGGTPDVVYYYFVFPVNVAGAGTGQWDTGYVATPAEVPSGLSGLSASDGEYTDKVILTWNAANGATGYDIYNATSEDGDRTLLGSTTETGATITEVPAGVVYYYFVFPTNDAGSGVGQWDIGYVAEASSNVSPVVGITGGNKTIADTNSVAGETVSFSASAADSDGSVVSTEWSVNDSVVATGLTPSIALPDGATVVTFRATDDDGAASTASVTITVQAPGAPQDGWPAPYNGITPDEVLNLEFNNIGVFDPEDQFIYTCLRVLNNGDPAEIDGIGRFDVALEIVSMVEGIIRVSRTRPFNEGGALNESGQEPSCSGYFETTLNTYEDIIQAGEQTLTTTFELIDPVNLELRLLSASEIQP